MTKDELEAFLDSKPFIELADDEENERLLFRDESLEWYRNDKNRCTAIDYWKILSKDFDEEQLLTEIRRGLMVEGITRITGYFSKTSSWNPGKLGELRARHRGGMH